MRELTKGSCWHDAAGGVCAIHARPMRKAYRRGGHQLSAAGHNADWPASVLPDSSANAAWW